MELCAALGSDIEKKFLLCAFRVPKIRIGRRSATRKCEKLDVIHGAESNSVEKKTRRISFEGAVQRRTIANAVRAWQLEGAHER